MLAFSGIITEYTTCTMNPAVSHLLYLRQSNRAIEEYVEDFCGLCHLAGFNNVVLNDMFRVGLNEPIRSRLPEGKIHWSLEQYIDHALLLSGSSYTVGVAEEERNNPPVSAKPESAHVMAATPESHRKMAATPESLAKTATMPESCQVTAVAKISPRDFFGGAIVPKLLRMRSLGQD